MSSHTAGASANELSGREVDVALRDGSTLHIRPVTAEDRPAIMQFLQALSPESIAFRFFGAPNLDWVAEWSTDVDYTDRYALVAVTGPDRAIVAHGAYMRAAPERAEVAFTVADAWQGQGSRRSCSRISPRRPNCRASRCSRPTVLPSNHRMIQVFRDSGFTVEEHSGEGVIEIEFPISRSSETRAALRAARPDRGGGRGQPLPRANVGGARRRVPRAGHGRR